MMSSRTDSGKTGAVGSSQSYLKPRLRPPKTSLTSDAHSVSSPLSLSILATFVLRTDHWSASMHAVNRPNSKAQNATRIVPSLPGLKLCRASSIVASSSYRSCLRCCPFIFGKRGAAYVNCTMTTMEWMQSAKVYPINRIKNLRVTHIDDAAQNALKIKSETTHFIVRWRRIHEDGV